MNAEVREILRNNLLLQLASASTMGLTVKTLALGAHAAGLPAEAETVRAEVEYLHDKGLLIDAVKTISPENRRHRITADGRDYLATQNLA
jgi:hypothetical protein